MRFAGARDCHRPLKATFNRSGCNVLGVIPNQFGIDLIGDDPLVVFDSQVHKSPHFLSRVDRSGWIVWAVD